MDRYVKVRGLHLLSVLEALGFTGWKKRKGKEEWYGPCPLHRPANNTTCFSFTHTLFRCFSCEAKGSGAIDLIMQVRGIGFNEAVEALGALSVPISVPSNGNGATAPEESLISQNKPFHGSYEKFYVASPWLSARGLTDDTLRRFGVGEYSNPSRHSPYAGKIMIPIKRPDGVQVGYLARNPSGEPKYIFPAGFRKHLELYGATHIKKPKCVFLVESPFAVMKFRQLGFDAVSPFGWSVSPEQLSILAGLRPRGVLYLPDSGKYEAGKKVASFISERLWVKYPRLPVADPENLTPEQIQALL